MIKMDMNRIYQQVARQYHTTPEEVRREIQKSIDAAFDQPADDLTAYRLRQIPCKGARPTPEEFIVYVAQRAMDEI